MTRLHLIEFHEQAWLPQVLRRGVTSYLRTAMEVAGQHQLVIPLLTKVLKQLPTKTVLDMGSGAGGPWPSLLGPLSEPVGPGLQVRLSDANPRPDAWEPLAKGSGGKLSFIDTPVDARAVPAELRGLRTLFNLFHHFRPADARAILADATAKQQPIFIVEAMDKSWLQGIMIFLLAPLLTLLLTPRIRPLTAGQLIFTYLIPLIPLLVAWDGLVSVIRLHSHSSLKAWTAELPVMVWEEGEIREKGKVVRYLIGMPEAVAFQATQDRAAAFS